MSDKEKLEKIKQLATKWAGASEFFDELITNGWVELTLFAKKFINQIGEQLLEIIEGEKIAQKEKEKEEKKSQN